MKTIPSNQSTVFIGNVAESNLNSIIAKYAKDQIFVLVDENTEPLFGYLFEGAPELQNVELIQVESGEANKNIETVFGVWKYLSDINIRRNALLVNLGGGVITDMGGFIASTYKRGIDFVNVPTTLLSMVDASVGGKTGIDLDNFKNQVGVFNEPVSVYCDANFLNSLPKNELISGYAEVLKHGLIKDANYWRYCVETGWESLDWDKVIYESVLIKNQIVMNDPKEKGERKLLNFGHTIGHAIETWMLNNNQPILHGEGVAIGMICESYLSSKVVGMSTGELEQVSAGILKLFPKIELPEAHFVELLELMKNDKKNNSDEINFTMLKGIGEGVFDNTSNAELIIESLNYYQGL